MNTITVFANDQEAYEYDKGTTLDEKQLEFLDKIDRDMDKGIKIKGELISDPDSHQRATFVAMNLVRALRQDNDAIISVSCAYLANRLPALTEVRANDHEGSVNIELVEEPLH